MADDNQNAKFALFLQGCSNMIKVCIDVVINHCCFEKGYIQYWVNKNHLLSTFLREFFNFGRSSSSREELLKVVVGIFDATVGTKQNSTTE